MAEGDIGLSGRGERAGMFFGWRVVGAAFTVATFAWGIGFYGPPIFLQTIHVARGWPVSLVSAAITSHYLLGAVVIARLAALHSRFGLAGVTRAGGVLTGLGLLGWALAREPWQLFAATALSGAGWAMTSAAALNAMVAPWFIRRRPAALSMAYNGASMGGVIFSPLWVGLIAALGFTWAALLVAFAVTATLWVLAGRYLARDPNEMGLLPDGDTPHGVERAPMTPAARPGPRGLWRDRRFVTLATGAALALFAQIGLVAQLFSLLVPPLGEAGAGATMGLATVCAIGGRTVLGLMMRPDTSRRSVTAATLALQACGSVALLAAAGTSVPLLLLGCVLFGLGLGNVASLPSLIAQSDFAAAEVPRVVALVTATSQACFAFAPLAFGMLRDLGKALGLDAGSAAPLLFAAAAAIQLAAVAVFLLGRRRGAAA